ncbi:hypothetical protein DASC09_021260 [Saccharomycopsis crataegensis]|uniref:Peroxidase n=1 Tax=Saccharomycopsis crataegensis TaxID=43959 RepID=A0AAV5QJK5_9ASCO|nr:hypothetical protein DASC09_021260 [Saccharomycopsis crataegensis]
MPLLRIIFENSRFWLNLIRSVIRVTLIPLTLLLMFYDWFLEDIIYFRQLTGAVIKEILHISPCVFGLFRSSEIEDPKYPTPNRMGPLKRESDFFLKKCTKIFMKCNVGLQNLVNGSLGELKKRVEVCGKRYRQGLRFWYLTKDTEDWIFHYPKCFIKLIIAKLQSEPVGKKGGGGFDDAPKLRTYNSQNMSHGTKRGSLEIGNSIKRVSGVRTLPPTTVEFDNELILPTSAPRSKDKEVSASMSLPLGTKSIENCYSISEDITGNYNGKTFRSKLRFPVLRSARKEPGPLIISHNKIGDYSEVKKSIISVIDNNAFDDGSLGPVVVRLAWHCCATYDKDTGTGGSNGGTIRLPPELTDDGNIGLQPAMLVLEIVKQQFPWITYADLYTLAGATAIEALGGPKIEWKSGRTDVLDTKYVPENGRLPIGSKNSDHIRNVFGRMGFNDQEIVCLIGAHTLGRTHKKYSGWEGKWTDDPIKFDNEFYKVLLDNNWEWRTVPETGKYQYFQQGNNDIMMLQTDMEMIKDSEFHQWVEVYAKDQDKYFEDFAKVFSKLLELGVQRNEQGIAIKAR